MVQAFSTVGCVAERTEACGGDSARFGVALDTVPDMDARTETNIVAVCVACAVAVPDSVSVGVGADRDGVDVTESEMDRVFEKDADVVTADVRDGVAPENVLVGVNGELELGVWLIDMLGVS
eukprot:PhM_4_TR17450/c3_g2_i2/m.36596